MARRAEDYDNQVFQNLKIYRYSLRNVWEAQSMRAGSAKMPFSPLGDIGVIVIPSSLS